MLADAEIRSLISNLAQAIEAYVASNIAVSDPLLIGIHSGGAWIAEQIHQQTQNPHPLGTLDISFYRDDFSQIGLNPQVRTSNLPASIEQRHIILIDDVLHSGRTIRAAMNELFDYGRPESITLAVLVDREGRELPIQPELCGMNIKLAEHQQIKLQRENDRFSLSVIDQSKA